MEKKLLCSLFVLWPANVKNTGQGVINSGATFRDQYLPIVGKCQLFIKHMLICLCLSLQICIITSLISSLLVGSFCEFFALFCLSLYLLKCFHFVLLAYTLVSYVILVVFTFYTQLFYSLLQ